MMVLSQPCRIFKNGFLVRLGTVSIAKSDEVEGNEQSLLEAIMWVPEIMDSLDRQFQIMDIPLHLPGKEFSLRVESINRQFNYGD
jgi:hypothetical protein